MVFVVDGGPAEGNTSDPGVWKPSIEYSTPLRGDAVRFSATTKKYPKFMIFSTSSMITGSMSAVSISACPELSCASLCLLMTPTSSDPGSRAFRF
jgi:hypothetical protein